MCPASLESFLSENCFLNDEGLCVHRLSKRKVKAVVPMHSFGQIGHVQDIEKICNNWGLVLLEDASQSLGSTIGEFHSGSIGKLGGF